MNDKIAIVTVLYKSDDVLEGFFKSISQQNFTNFFIYIIDNSVSDNSTQLLNKFLEIYQLKEKSQHVKNESNVGIAKGNNIGISLAFNDAANYILLANNDIEFYQADIFDKMISKAADNAIVCPKLFYFERKNIIWYAGSRISKITGLAPHYGQGKPDGPEFSKEKMVEYGPTCFMLFQAKIFKEVGLMDENYFVYFDDTDFMLNLHRSKKKILYCPEETVIHKVSSSTGGNESAFTLHHSIRNHVFYIRKNFNFVEKIILLGFATAFFLYKELKVIFYNPSNVLIIPKAYIEGFKLKL